MRLNTTATHGRPGKIRLSLKRDTNAELALMNSAGGSVDRNGTQGSTPGYAAQEGDKAQDASPNLLPPVGRRLEFGTPREDGVVGRKEHDASAGSEAAPGRPVPKGAAHGGGSVAPAPRRDSLEGTGGGVAGGTSKGARVVGEGPVRSPAPGKGDITGNSPAASPRLPRPVLLPAAVAAGPGAGAAAPAGDAEPPRPPQRQRQQPVQDCGQRAAENAPIVLKSWYAGRFIKDGTMRIDVQTVKFLVDDAAMEKAKKAVQESGALEVAGVATVYARRKDHDIPAKFPGVVVEAYNGMMGVQWRLSKLEKLRKYLSVLSAPVVYRSVEVLQDGVLMLVVNLHKQDLGTVQETEEPQSGVHEQQLGQEGDGRGVAGSGCVEHSSGQREADHPDVEGGEAAPHGTKRAQPEQQEQQQGAPGGEGDEGGAGPSGLFASGGAWQGAEGAGGERPGKRQRPASSDTEHQADQGALPDGEGYPVPNAPMDAEVQEVCCTYDMLVAAREEAKARAAALAVDKAALEGQLDKERKAKEAAERERDREMRRAVAAQQKVGREKERADAAEVKVAALEAQLQAERARAEAADAKFRYIQKHFGRGKQ